MAFIVVYDACVLHPAPLRDLLVRIAVADIVQARWSDRILDECFRSILERRPELPVERLQRTRELMNRAVRDCLVSGFEDLEAGLELPDPDDCHVLAAAIKSGAQVIVTFNLKDFPDEVLTPYGVEAKHPDDFVLEALHLAPGAVCAEVAEQARVLKNPPTSVATVLEGFPCPGPSTFGGEATGDVSVGCLTNSQPAFPTIGVTRAATNMLSVQKVLIPSLPPRHFGPPRHTAPFLCDFEWLSVR